MSKRMWYMYLERKYNPWKGGLEYISAKWNLTQNIPQGVLLYEFMHYLNLPPSRCYAQISRPGQEINHEIMWRYN